MKTADAADAIPLALALALEALALAYGRSAITAEEGRRELARVRMAPGTELEDLAVAVWSLSAPSTRAQSAALDAAEDALYAAQLAQRAARKAAQ